jgi:DNA polymerase-3 subunit alpha
MMRKMKVRMIEGALEESGIDKATMERFWKQLEDFAAYCFNKSHAACYGLIAYQTAYLKAHYPAAFMAALMTSDYDDTDRLAIEITECQHMNMSVLPPDINESFVEFAVVPDVDNPDNRKASIRFGMNAIKNVGTNAVEEILRARKEHGRFESLEQFFERVSCRIVNRKALESLIKAGAFDRYGDRSMLLHNLDYILAYASRIQKQAQSGQTDLFGNLEETSVAKARLTLEPATITFNTRDQLLWERELLGLYLSQHPLELFGTILAEQTVPLNSIRPEHDGKQVTIGGAVTDIREITTKNGQKMAFIKIEDQFGSVEVLLFPAAYQQTLGIWQRDSVVLIRGKVTARDRDGNMGTEIKVVVNDAREITVEQANAYQTTGRKLKVPKAAKAKANAATAKGPGAKAVDAPTLSERVYIRLADSQDQQLLVNLKQMLDAAQGSTEVVLVLGRAEDKQAIKLPGGIQRDAVLLGKLETLVGSDNVRIR